MADTDPCKDENAESTDAEKSGTEETGASRIHLRDSSVDTPVESHETAAGGEVAGTAMETSQAECGSGDFKLPPDTNVESKRGEGLVGRPETRSERLKKKSKIVTPDKSIRNKEASRIEGEDAKPVAESSAQTCPTFSQASVPPASGTDGKMKEKHVTRSYIDFYKEFLVKRDTEPSTDSANIDVAKVPGDVRPPRPDTPRSADVRDASAATCSSSASEESFIEDTKPRKLGDTVIEKPESNLPKPSQAEIPQVTKGEGTGHRAKKRKLQDDTLDSEYISPKQQKTIPALQEGKRLEDSTLADPVEPPATSEPQSENVLSPASTSGGLSSPSTQSTNLAYSSSEDAPSMKSHSTDTSESL